jgi:hypothetical protein
LDTELFSIAVVVLSGVIFVRFAVSIKALAKSLVQRQQSYMLPELRRLLKFVLPQTVMLCSEALYFARERQ